jgi:hypothetical protein
VYSEYLGFIAARASQAGEDYASETRGKNAEEENHLTDTPQSKLDIQDEDSMSCTDSVQ